MQWDHQVGTQAIPSAKGMPRHWIAEDERFGTALRQQREPKHLSTRHGPGALWASRC
jgi:hypothetical protein